MVLQVQDLFWELTTSTNHDPTGSRYFWELTTSTNHGPKGSRYFWELKTSNNHGPKVSRHFLKIKLVTTVYDFHIIWFQNQFFFQCEHIFLTLSIANLNELSDDN